MTNVTWTKSLADMWNRYPQPIRPTQSCVSLFELFIHLTSYETNGNGSILILGSTPELRDLASTSTLSVTIVDYSVDIYKALTTLMKTPNSKERFIQKDWRLLDEGERFDLILAEASLNVLPRQDVSTFLGNVKNHLNKSGRFVSKTWVKAPSTYSIEQLVSDYRRFWQDKMTFYSYSCGYLWQMSEDKGTETVALQDMYRMCKDFYSNKIINLPEWESIQNLDYELVDLKLYIPNKEKIMDLYQEFFSIDMTLQVDFANSNLYPFIVSRPK